jgi:hypothetical protein
VSETTIQDVRDTVSAVTHPDFRYEVTVEHDVPYLRVLPVQGRDARTAEPLEWSSRKWRLSLHMTDGEIVQTALKATLTAVEHETRELFTFMGESIFDPHYDVYQLLALRRRANAIKERAKP